MSSTPFRSKFISKLIMTPKASALWVAVLLIVISAIFINLRYEYLKQRKDIEMSFLLNSAHKNFEQTLKASYNSNIAIALTINDNGVPENFEKVAANIIAINPIIDIIELIPNGVIKYVYPLKNNESVLNYDILKNPAIAKEARRAIDKKAVYFAGPIELRQGGLAVAGRYPVYIKNKFWGFSAVLIRFDDLMNSCGMYSNVNPNYYFQFSKTNFETNEEKFFLSQPTNFQNKNFKKIAVADGDWNLYIVDNVSNTYFMTELLPYLLFCALLILILPYFIYVILKKPHELELINSMQELRMKESQAKFQIIFNKTSIAIAQIDLKTHEFIEVNPQFCSLLAVAEKRLAGKSLSEFIHPEDLKDFDSFINSSNVIVKDNKQLNIRLKNSLDKYIWTRVVPSPVIHENQESKSIILAIENISEQKIAKEQLVQSEMQFKSLFQESPIPLWEEDGTAVREYLEELGLLGKSREYVREFLEKNPNTIYEVLNRVKVIGANQECLDLYQVADKYDLSETFKRTVRLSPTDAYVTMITDITQGLTKGTVQTNVIFPSGRKLIIAMAWNIVEGYEKSFGRLIIATQDITASITAQQLVASSEQKLQSIINSIDGIVWEYNVQQSKFNYVSKQTQTILGYKVEEWYNSETFWEDHLHPEDRTAAISYYKEKIKSTNSYNFEYRMIAKNGNTVWFRDVVNVHSNSEGSMMLRGIKIDISPIKENEKDLQRSLEMVTEQNKRLLNFSYIVSHNLRSHTSNIQSLVTLIKESQDFEEQKKLLHLVGTVSTELNDTISNLNEVINIRKNVNLNVQNLRLVEFVLKTLDVLTEDLRRKNIKIIGKVPPTAIVSYNRAYLQSVLINIISNAVRYCKKVDDQRYIKFNYYEEADYTVLEIEDNGIGINMHRNKDKIFGLYKTFSTNKDAKGLGLFLTKNQVEAMGGKIEIQSEINKGTTVRIYFKN